MRGLSSNNSSLLIHLGKEHSLPLSYSMLETLLMGVSTSTKEVSVQCTCHDYSVVLNFRFTLNPNRYCVYSRLVYGHCVPIAYSNQLSVVLYSLRESSSQMRKRTMHLPRLDV